MRGLFTCGRRRVLAGLAGAAAAASMPAIMAGNRAMAAAMPAARTLSIRSLHTEERLTATFFRHGRYDPVALDEIDHLMRDWRTGAVKAIDRGLLDTLCLLHRQVGGTEPFDLISGYRSPQTNAALSQQNGGVARRSLHMDGMAADIRLPGCALRRLHQAAVALEAGGVGLYTRSNFIHVDTGRVRYWGS